MNFSVMQIANAPQGQRYATYRLLPIYRAKPSRKQSSRAIKLVNSADEKDAQTALNRHKLASNAFLTTASPRGVKRAISCRRSFWSA